MDVRHLQPCDVTHSQCDLSAERVSHCSNTALNDASEGRRVCFNRAYMQDNFAILTIISSACLAMNQHSHPNNLVAVNFRLCCHVMLYLGCSLVH